MSETCTPITIYSGPVNCLERDCDEYATEDGNERDIDNCSHISQQQACETHSVFSEDEWEYCTTVEPWPCQAASRPSGDR